MNLHDLFPNASQSFLALNSGQAPVVERHPRYAALGQAKAKALDSGRFLVRVTSFRRRLLDEDNLCEKYHVDCLRYSGVLPSDAADKAKIEVGQVKIGAKEPERIEIAVSRIPA